MVTLVYFETIFSLSLVYLQGKPILCKIWRDRNLHNEQSNLLDQKKNQSKPETET